MGNLIITPTATGVDLTDSTGGDVTIDGAAPGGATPRIQTGTTTITLAAATNGFVDITFPVAFASAPVVSPSVRDTSVFVPSHSLVTAAGFRLTIRDYQEVARSGTYTVTWIAVGT